MRVAGNEYNVQETAGAFGDLGTLIPFLIGYVTITRLDPQNLLLAFGVTAVISGLYFRTPLPVQPMKAIGTAAIAHAGVITAGAVWVAAAATGLAWLALGVSGLVTWVAALTSRPVVRGIVLGLGLSFILEGVTLMRSGPVLAIGGVILTLLLLGHARLPALLALLAYGAGAAFLLDSIATLFRLFPLPILGVILCFAGMKLASATADHEATRTDRTVLVVTAGIALWNMGVAYLAGLILYHAIRHRVVRL